MAENNMNGKDFLLGAVVGAALGAITALLLAPKSGRELRGDIAQQYHNVTEKTQEFAGVVKNKSLELAEKAKEVASSVTNDIKQWRESRKEVAPAAEIAEPEAEA
jgi:gas vesicle protein